MMIRGKQGGRGGEIRVSFVAHGCVIVQCYLIW